MSELINTTKIYNKYKVCTKGYTFTAPYNAPEGFSEKHCPECNHLVEGEGIFATGVKIVYKEYDHEYQPFEMEHLSNIRMVCANCNWNEYS